MFHPTNAQDSTTAASATIENGTYAYDYYTDYNYTDWYQTNYTDYPYYIYGVAQIDVEFDPNFNVVNSTEYQYIQDQFRAVQQVPLHTNGNGSTFAVIESFVPAYISHSEYVMGFADFLYNNFTAQGLPNMIGEMKVLNVWLDGVHVYADSYQININSTYENPTIRAVFVLNLEFDPNFLDINSTERQDLFDELQGSGLYDLDHLDDGALWDGNDTTILSVTLPVPSDYPVPSHTRFNYMYYIMMESSWYYHNFTGPLMMGSVEVQKVLFDGLTVYSDRYSNSTNSNNTGTNMTDDLLYINVSAVIGVRWDPSFADPSSGQYEELLNSIPATEMFPHFEVSFSFKNGLTMLQAEITNSWYGLLFTEQNIADALRNELKVNMTSYFGSQTPLVLGVTAFDIVVYGSDIRPETIPEIEMQIFFDIGYNPVWQDTSSTEYTTFLTEINGIDDTLQSVSQFTFINVDGLTLFDVVFPNIWFGNVTTAQDAVEVFGLSNQDQILSGFGAYSSSVLGISIFNTTVYGNMSNLANTTSPCRFLPCQIGARCTDTGFGGYACCIEDNCEQFNNPCISTPCANGGRCVAVDDDGMFTFECECGTAYTGETCETDVNECLNSTGNGTLNACVEHSTCNNTVGGYTCDCNSGYRGDGMVECFEIILFPYGSAAGDSMLSIPSLADTASNVVQVSPILSISPEIPFGDLYFDKVQFSEKGLIYFGDSPYVLSTAREPFNASIVMDGTVDRAVLAPFWDNFQLSEASSGRVYYQVYNYLDTYSASEEETVNSMRDRFREAFDVDDFEPGWTLKVTWSNVTMYPNYDSYLNYPSTFQAVVQSDGCYTYVMYLYEEGSMLWETGRRYADEALIGYTNGAEEKYVLSQGQYRPDEARQEGYDSSRNGEYFFDLTANSASTTKRNARCSCVQWYKEELVSEWTPNYEPCPCTLVQAWIDTRFWWSTDSVMDILNQYSHYSWAQRYNTYNTTEWDYDVLDVGSCYQFQNGSGPRCCYGSMGDDGHQQTWWRSWWLNTLFSGPLTSHYQRHQMPHVDDEGWIFLNNFTSFEAHVNTSLIGDMIPRRQCCVESESATHCGLYTSLRPPATCDGYTPRESSWFWGDPHFTTSDGSSYTFNGIGEYWMVYAPGTVLIQTRLEKALTENGDESQATAFVGFAAQEEASNSGKVEFLVNGLTGVIVRVDGVNQTVSQAGSRVSGIQLKLEEDNGANKYTATFDQGTSVTVGCSDGMLELELTQTEDARGVSKGLMGTWNSNTDDDFELRNGDVVDVSTLQPTAHLDVLEGSLLEAPLYEFGQSWRLQNEAESLFTYTDTDFATLNPSGASEPPFLENLLDTYDGTDYLDDIKANCTTGSDISRTCVFDYLMTNKSSVATQSQSVQRSSVQQKTLAANTSPNITAIVSDSFVNGFLRCQIDNSVNFTVEASDADNDNITFSIYSPPTGASTSVVGVTIDADSGVATWTPNVNDNDLTGDGGFELTVVATDANGATALRTVPIKLCRCLNGGDCAYSSNMGGTQNYQIAGCTCTEAWTGDYCEDDRNGCRDGDGCYTGVTCIDKIAPEVGATCGPCPTGTTGDGTTCRAINHCDSNPCNQICETLFDDYECSCLSGYTKNGNMCDDIDECAASPGPCATTDNSACVNGPGNFSCECNAGFEKDPTGATCVDTNECSSSSLNTCSVDNGNECANIYGDYICTCLTGYQKSTTIDKLACEDINECAADNPPCTGDQTCTNTVGSFVCVDPRAPVTDTPTTTTTAGAQGMMLSTWTNFLVSLFILAFSCFVL